MKNYPLYHLIRKKESIGLLCNQSGWHPATGLYSFQMLAAAGKLSKVFVPEHGLFGELQDQVKLDDATVYKQVSGDVEWISLYSSATKTYTAAPGQLAGLDTLVIDIQDTGSRYYTYITSIYLLLKQVTELRLDLTVIVLDKPNPAGRIVEGSRMPAEYSSFIGLAGLPHRHGLTTGELCRYFRQQLNGHWKLVVKPASRKDHVFIAPSPNIPSVTTCGLYSGQCLWEGTNISEGRGTTLPFETIGAPFLDWVFSEDWNHTGNPVYNKHCLVRPLLFQPVYHKYSGQLCKGIHLVLLNKEKYHSLSHSLRLLRYCREKTRGFSWRPGPYEAFSNKTAIELLAGDRLLLDYLENKADWKEIKSWLAEEESEWIREASPFLIYKAPLQKIKLK